MKRLFYFSMCIVALTMTSCNDYLSVDKYVNDMLNVDKVFANKNYTEKWLWGTYAYLNGQGAEITNKGNGWSSFNFASDDAIYGDWVNLGEKYQNCQYSASDQLTEDRWWHLYQGIRRATIFIDNVDKCKDLTADVREDYRGQARFLRAYFYWMLMKQWGPVPIMPEPVMATDLSYENLSIERSSYDECVDYVSKEFVDAARVLPLSRSSAWLGQATRGAALAARAKVLLFAASPLYNGNIDLYDLKNKDGKQLINQAYSEEKWAKAAAAAKEVIDLKLYELNTVQDTTFKLPVGVPVSNYPDGCGGINPIKSYSQCFNGELATSSNPEFVFLRPDRGAHDVNDIILHCTPSSLSGWNTLCATQKQVDAYYMCDGSKIDLSSTNYPYQISGFTVSNSQYKNLPANVSLQYANREPRFYASIAFSGSIWENSSTNDSKLWNKQIFYYKGTNDGKKLSTPENYLRTGVGIKKYRNPADSWNVGGVIKAKVEPTIRYADVLLWYAESLNELTKSYTITSWNNSEVTVTRNINEMQKSFSRVRYRAGLPNASDLEYGNSDDFRKVLKHERQIEFFIEAARYFDLRRWKDAAVEEAKPIIGLNVDIAESSRAQFYVKQPANMRKIFLSKMYLWPIPQWELTKNGKIVQNPGW